MNDPFTKIVNVSNTSLKEISDTVELLTNKQSELQAAQAEVERITAEIRELEFVTIPEMMFSARVQEMTTASGAKVAMKPYTRALWPKEEPGITRAVEWMKDNGCEGAINVVVEAAYARGDFDKAQEEYLRLRGDNSAKVSIKQTSPWNTLSKLMGERLAAGLPVDQDLFNMHIGHRVTVKEKGR